MTLSEQELEFIKANRSVAMITVADDGIAKAARVAIGLLDGRLLSSGTRDRVRTVRLQRDPRCTLYIHDPRFAFLVLETTVTILDGPDIATHSLAFFREVMQNSDGPLNWFGAVLSEEEFLQTMVDEGRILYDFAVAKSYGLFGI